MAPNVGVVRFNFTTELYGCSLYDLKKIVLDRLRGSGIDIAENTLSMQIEGSPGPELRPPPLPGFHEIRGSIRRRS